MKISFLTTITLLIVSTLVNAQEKADAVLAKEHYSKAVSFYRQGKYDSSNVYVKKGADLYKKIDDWDRYLSGLSFISQNDRLLGKFETAIQSAKFALAESQSHFKEGHHQEASAYYQLANIYYVRGYLDEAEKYHLLGLEVREKLSEGAHYGKAASYNALGIIYNARGYHDQAILYYGKALKGYDDSSGSIDRSIGDTYFNMGHVCVNQGKFDKALEYYQKALKVFAETIGLDHPTVGAYYNNVGVVYLRKKEFHQALEYFNKSLMIREKMLSKDHPDIAVSINMIGVAYYHIGEYDKSLDQHKEALQMAQRMIEKDDVGTYSTYENLGSVYMQKNVFDSALHYFRKSIDYQLETIGSHNNSLARSYAGHADVLFKKGSIMEALASNQKALIANIVDFNDTSIYVNPTLENSLSRYFLLEFLQSKAEGFERLYLENHEINDLKFSLSTFQLCDSLTDQINKSHQRFNDKINVGKGASDIYRSAIRVAYLLYEKTNEPEYLDLVFYFGEKSKASTLAQNSSANYAKHYAKLPDSLLQLERSQKVDQSYYLSQILEMKTQDQKLDSSKLFQFQNNLFVINNRLDSLAAVFEKNYPNYYQLKYRNTHLSPSEIQKKIASNQVLLEYIETDSSVHVFTITRKYFWIDTFEKDAVFNNALDQYRSSFNPETLQAEFSEHYPQFTQSSYTLYNRLLEPILSRLPNEMNQLIIVPTDKLSYVPWGLLISNDQEDCKGKDYKGLDYLIKTYAVSYGYSANLLFQDVYSNNSNSKKSVLALAPSYAKDNEANYENLQATFRDNMGPLKWNSAEINEIGKLFPGDYLIGEKATEGSFKQAAKDHSILHLAMHAFVDDENPMLSKLIFFQDNDSIEDGMLHTHELFNMDLSAEMVVLSACKTGLGKLQVGEGLMSLGRAFAYAGCPSVVSSHWSVDDQSTSQLMASFYKYIADGMSKDKALQKAKLDFLASTNGPKTHPYYWGGFVVLGDTSPLSKKINYTFIILAIFMVIMPIGIWWFMRDPKPEVLV